MPHRARRSAVRRWVLYCDVEAATIGRRAANGSPLDPQMLDRGGAIGAADDFVASHCKCVGQADDREFGAAERAVLERAPVVGFGRVGEYDPAHGDNCGVCRIEVRANSVGKGGVACVSRCISAYPHYILY